MKRNRVRPRTAAASSLGLAVLTLVMSGAAMADTRAVYSAATGEVVIEVRDRDNIRYRMPDGGFLLITDGEAHALNRDESGWFAVPGAQVAAMARQGGGPNDVRLSGRNDQQTVAGITGQTFTVEQGDSWADEWELAGEVILTEDPRLSHLGPAFARLAELFGGVDEARELTGLSGGQAASLAPLRSAGMELTSFTTDQLPDRSFSLPPNVRHVELTASADAGDSAEPREPGWLTREMMNTGQDVRDDATRETRGEIRRNIRQGVRSLF